MEWMLLPLRRYAQFSGRSRRKEYWMFLLFCVIARFVLTIIDNILGFNFTLGLNPVGPRLGLLAGLFALATFIPSLAVGVRRLHDTDRSGWWILAVLVAIVPGAVLMAVNLVVGMAAIAVGALGASILLIVYMCQDGTRGDNRYGPDPKSPDLADVFA